jgi:hypothetical protein
MALMDKRVLLATGFDPFSGVERPKREHVTRECPTEGHDVWVFQPSPARDMADVWTLL